MDREYKFSIAQCDVDDKEKLARFREKRTEWVTLLERDETHSISNQLSALVWQDAVYRLLNETRRFGTEDNPSSAIAPLLAQSLDTGYINGMILGVGRLTDLTERRPERGTVSLRRIFDDIRKSRNFITREIFVCYDGCVYDPATVEPASLRGAKLGVLHGVQIGGLSDAGTPTRLHRHFDGISGIQSDQRSRDDLISIVTLDKIDAMLSVPAITKLRELRNKYVAHAADATSRAAASLSEFGVSLFDVEQALKSLVKANHNIQIDLLYNSDSSVMPQPQFDITEHLTEPFIRKEYLPNLQSHWKRIIEEREGWRG